MAKKKKLREADTITEDKLFWFMTTAYILRAVRLLDKEKERKLDSLDELGAGNWKDNVRESLCVDDKFIRSIYALCTEYRDRTQAVAFILRGFGCPCADERMFEFSELRGD